MCKTKCKSHAVVASKALNGVVLNNLKAAFNAVRVLLVGRATWGGGMLMLIKCVLLLRGKVVNK